MNDKVRNHRICFNKTPDILYYCYFFPKQSNRVTDVQLVHKDVYTRRRKPHPRREKKPLTRVHTIRIAAVRSLGSATIRSL